MTDQALEIRLTKKTRSVRLETEPGVTKEYTLREMDGKQRDNYFNINKKRHKTVGKQMVLQDFKGLYSTLIHHCLYDDDGKQVEESVIQTYPSEAQEALFGACQSLNKLDKPGSRQAMGNIQAILVDRDDDPELCLQLIRQTVEGWAKGNDDEGED